MSVSDAAFVVDCHHNACGARRGRPGGLCLARGGREDLLLTVAGAVVLLISPPDHRQHDHHRHSDHGEEERDRVDTHVDLTTRLEDHA